MASERLLKTTLAQYHDTGHAPQQPPAPADDRVFGSTTTLLATLSNPLNITLLTSHFLAAPAVWQPALHSAAVAAASSASASAAAAQTCFRVVSVFHTAAVHVRRHEVEEAAAARHGLAGWVAYRRGLSATEDQRPGSEAWARAVAQGADAQSPRWRHLLALTGVLLGLESGGRAALSRSRRAALEQGVVAAANLALAEAAAAADRRGVAAGADAALARYAVVMSLGYAFPLLAEHARAQLHGDVLLPAILEVLAGPFGFDGGRILDAVAADARLVPAPAPAPGPGSGPAQPPLLLLHWPAASASFQLLQQRETQQAVSVVASAAGPLAAMAAFAIQERAVATSPAAVLRALDALLALADGAAARWAAAPALADLDLSLDDGGEQGGGGLPLTAETAQTTWPLLWQHLKKMLYAAAVVLQAVVGRSLLDGRLAADGAAPQLASTALRVLRGLDFVATRQSAGHFQAHRFAYLASIDILARYPAAAADFLSQLKPAPAPGGGGGGGGGASAPLRLAGDLFYLNLAEHFAGVLPAAACDRLLIQPALPYVAAPAADMAPPHVLSPRLVEVFEAAHSATLAVLSCAHNAAIAATLGPLYAEALLAAFPGRIAARQFRLAFKTLIQILSPPFPVYATHPHLAETLLEMVRFRAATTAGTAPLPPPRREEGGDEEAGPAASEQSALVLTLIDALPFLALPVLADWMTTAAEAVWTIADGGLRQTAQQRFWEVLGSGEMDVERAALGVAWWGNGGGGALVMTGGQQRQPSSGWGAEAAVMSSALPAKAASRL